MPRLARYIENNGYYHVISRSINQTPVFKDDEDFSRFRHLEAQAKQRYPLRLFHYALMHTHFHFVLQATTKDMLSAHLSYVKWHYTQWMKKKYGWSGPLWRERYKSLPIENEQYLAACGAYVEFNPVRAGICRHPVDYPYSSSRHYYQGQTDKLVDAYDFGSVPATVQGFHYDSASAKAVFSRSQAIGSRWFVEQHRRK